MPVPDQYKLPVNQTNHDQVTLGRLPFLIKHPVFPDPAT